MTIVILQHLLDITHLGLARLICRVVEYSLETPVLSTSVMAPIL